MNELSGADAQARERAIDPYRSILLQAPAGSGKTSILTQRFLRLLCTVDEPGAILAITFTRKAAAEMRARVTQALRGEIASADPCAAELRALTAAALRHGATRGWSLAHIIRDQLAAARECLPPALLRDAQQLPGVGPLGSDSTHLPAWKRLAACSLTGGRWRVRLTEELLGPAYAERTTREALRSCIGQLRGVPGGAELLQGVAALPAAALSETDAAAIAALSRVLECAARELHVEFAQAGRVDYTYVTGAARAALTDAGLPTELALRTGLAFTHILVDEFQDTSLAQFQLLASLTAAWEEGDGRTLFIVGDPMQSIYRFRDAEVGLFISAREHGIGNVRLTPLRLTRNFRATPALVDWSNEVFAQVFPAADELRAGAIAFSASVPARVRGERSPPAH